MPEASNVNRSPPSSSSVSTYPHFQSHLHSRNIHVFGKMSACPQAPPLVSAPLKCPFIGTSHVGIPVQSARTQSQVSTSKKGSSLIHLSSDPHVYTNASKSNFTAPVKGTPKNRYICPPVGKTTIDGSQKSAHTMGKPSSTQVGGDVGVVSTPIYHGLAEMTRW